MFTMTFFLYIIIYHSEGLFGSLVFLTGGGKNHGGYGKGGIQMEERQLRKFLAGLCLTGLLSGAGMAGVGNAQQTQSG